jgi:hypothetical protein
MIQSGAVFDDAVQWFVLVVGCDVPRPAGYYESFPGHSDVLLSIHLQPGFSPPDMKNLVLPGMDVPEGHVAFWCDEPFGYIGFFRIRDAAESLTRDRIRERLVQINGHARRRCS